MAIATQPRFTNMVIGDDVENSLISRRNTSHVPSKERHVDKSTDECTFYFFFFSHCAKRIRRREFIHLIRERRMDPEVRKQRFNSVHERGEAFYIPEESFQKSKRHREADSSVVPECSLCRSSRGSAAAPWAEGDGSRRSGESALLFMAILILKWYLMSHRHQGRSI